MEGKKYIVHVPTEQYGFISCELEGEATDAVEAYKEIVEANKPQSGVSAKEFNSFMDVYINTGHAPEGGMDIWQNMSEIQKKVIDEVRKCIKRTNNK